MRAVGMSDDVQFGRAGDGFDLQELIFKGYGFVPGAVHAIDGSDIDFCPFIFQCIRNPPPVIHNS